MKRFFAAALALVVSSSGAWSQTAQDVPDVRLFFEAAGQEKEQAEAALAKIAEGWKDGYAGLFIDIVRFLPSSRRRPGSVSSDGDPFGRDPLIPSAASTAEDQPFGTFPGATAEAPAASHLSPRAKVRARLIRFLEKQTGEDFGDDLSRWRKWVWNRPYEPHPDYALFKAVLYGQLDRRMVEFFPPGKPALVRLDEVDWGGVGVNGIPPLDHPKHIPASEADYLDDDHIVFGIALNGEVRAYPRRILAWHEMARDRIGGTELAVVYCTLCGTVVPYGAEVGETLRTFGTSGLLYRSNKLMFDEESKSLWSTAEGRPVIGELAGTDLELEIFPVVTTTWKEWRTLHPTTVVLSTETGFERDYSEGAAYRDYFRTDRLMFGVPKTDKRLKNKDEVLALLFKDKAADSNAERKALAISAKFLKKNPVYQIAFEGHDLVVITSKKGANRVYAADGRRFVGRIKDGSLRDAENKLWQLTEQALVSRDASQEPLPRIPARRAFWFGWYAQFPDSELIR